MEQKSIERLNQLHPKIRKQALDAYAEAVKVTPSGVHPYITQTLRTFKESDDLYAQGRTVKGDIVTNAKAGQSYHNYGLALDFVIQRNGVMDWSFDNDWQTVVNVFKKHGFIWGADWNNNGITKAQGDKTESIVDAPHFQMTLGYRWKQLLALHNAGKVDKNGYVII